MNPPTCIFRAPLAAVVLLPALLWLSVPVVWICDWPPTFGDLSAIGLAVLAWWTTRSCTGWVYSLASLSLPKGRVYKPGQDFLLFELEDLATVDKLKLMGDEIGYIFREGEFLRIRTDKRDQVLSPASLQMAIYSPKGKAVGVLLRWPEAGDYPAYEGVASFKYLGKDANIGLNTERRCQWAMDLIRGWA